MTRGFESASSAKNAIRSRVTRGEHCHGRDTISRLLTYYRPADRFLRYAQRKEKGKIVHRVCVVKNIRVRGVEG